MVLKLVWLLQVRIFFIKISGLVFKVFDSFETTLGRKLTCFFIFFIFFTEKRKTDVNNLV